MRFTSRCTRRRLKDLLTCVHDIPIRGLSITMPYKQQIVELLSNSDPLTRQIGACNTVVRSQDGKLYGFNTDVAGIVVPLEQRMTLAGAKVLVVGAGGVARAAAFGLKSKGAEVFITNRTPEKGQALARQAKAKYMKRADVAKASFDVIINATPLGMGTNKQSPLEDKELNTKYLFDLVYIPAETRLMQDGQGEEHPDHSRAGDVRAAGRAPVRDLDGQARTNGRDGFRGEQGSGAARRPGRRRGAPSGANGASRARTPRPSPSPSLRPARLRLQQAKRKRKRQPQNPQNKRKKAQRRQPSAETVEHETATTL